MKNIYFIGLPGCGKTTLGKTLAQQLGIPFLDLDSEIEALAGMPIPKIFSGYGEPFFRDLESRALHSAAQKGGQLVATGGGCIMRAENARCMRESGVVVFIDRPVSHILKDIHIQHRPLLQDGPQKLLDLSAQRRDTYLQNAHFVYQNEGTPTQAAEDLALFCAVGTRGDFAVIGWPIGHSLSPAIHNGVFESLGLPHRYGAIAVPPGKLDIFIAGVRAFGLQGFNVTIPHKQDIMPFLDDIQQDAADCGAVNTVALRSGRLCGTNTDMEGLNQVLQKNGSGFAGRRILLLGAGGVARAIAFKACREKAASIQILARDVQKCRQVALPLHPFAHTPVHCGGFTSQELVAAAQNCDVLIHCTPLGMQGTQQDFESLDFLEALPKTALVCDLVYNPPKTTLLQRAEQLGLTHLNGLGMLIYQALLADEFFLQQTLTKEPLFDTLYQTLNNKQEKTT